MKRLLVTLVLCSVCLVPSSARVRASQLGVAQFGGPQLTEAFKITEAFPLRQTIGTVPVVAYTYPLDELKIAEIEVTVLLFNREFISSGTPRGGAVKATAIFGRRPGESVQRAGNPQLDVLAHNFQGTPPSVDIVANGNNIEVRLTGQANQTMRWHLDIKVRETT